MLSEAAINRCTAERQLSQTRASKKPVRSRLLSVIHPRRIEYHLLAP